MISVMPEFIKNWRLLTKGGRGGFKQSYTYPELPGKVILMNEKDRPHTYEINGEEALTEEQVKGYNLSRFYLRKILHLMEPEFFPNIHFGNQTGFVVQEVKGEKRSGTRLTEGQQDELKEKMQAIGSNIGQLDYFMPNFFVDENEKVSYIDSTYDHDYFLGLTLDQIFVPGQPLSEIGKKLLNDYNAYVQYLDDPDATDFQLHEFDKEKVLQVAQAKGFSESQMKSLQAFIARYEHLTKSFPKIDAQALRKKIKDMLPKVLPKNEIDELNPVFLAWVGLRQPTET